MKSAFLLFNSENRQLFLFIADALCGIEEGIVNRKEERNEISRIEEFGFDAEATETFLDKGDSCVEHFLPFYEVPISGNNSFDVVLAIKGIHKLASSRFFYLVEIGFAGVVRNDDIKFLDENKPLSQVDLFQKRRIVFALLF